MAANLDLGTLKIAIGVENKEANKQILETKSNMDKAAEGAKGFLSNFGSGFTSTMKAAAAGVAAITTATVAMVKGVVDAAKETSEACDAIDKASQRMEVSASYYQELDFACQQSGISMATMEKAAKSLQASGSQLSFEEAIDQILACGDAAERSAMASELFGDKVAYEMQPLLNAGAEGFAELRQQAQDYGLVLSDELIADGAAFNDSLNLMNQTITRLKNRLAGEFLPSLTSITKGIAGIVAGVDGAQKEFEKGISSFVSSLAKTANEVLRMAPSIIRALITGIVQAIPMLAETATQIILEIVNILIENLPSIIDAGIQILLSLILGIAEALPELIPAITECITTIVITILDNIPLLIDAGLKLIVGLAEGFLKALPQVIAALPQIIAKVIDTLLGAISQFIDCGVRLLTALVENLPLIIQTIVAALPQIINNIISTLLNNIPLIVDAGVKLLIALIQNLPLIISTIIRALPQIISSIIQTLVNNIPLIVDCGVQLFVALVQNLPQIIAEISSAAGQVLDSIIQALSDGFYSMVSVGENLVQGLWQGIQNLAGWIYDCVSSWATGIWNTIKEKFGIASPSKKMKEIGMYLVQGLAIGISENTRTALDEVNRFTQAIEDAFNPVLDIDTIFRGYNTVSESAAFSSRLNNNEVPGGNQNNITQNNYFTTRELTPYEQQLEIERLNRELLEVYA